MGIKLIVVNINKCQRLLSEPYCFCSELRLNKASRINNINVRMQSYAAELALSYALSGAELLPPEYHYEKNGKPVIANGHISLSHSGEYAVCAYYASPVGVDIEILRTVSAKLKNRLLSPAELIEYENVTDVYYLLRKFVLKEAYLKMTGAGIAGGLNKIDIEGRSVLFDGQRSGFYTQLVFENAFCCVVSSEKADIETTHLCDEMFF